MCYTYQHSTKTLPWYLLVIATAAPGGILRATQLLQQHMHTSIAARIRAREIKCALDARVRLQNIVRVQTRKTQNTNCVTHMSCTGSRLLQLQRRLPGENKKNSKISNDRSNQLQQQSAVAVPRITAVSIVGGSSSSSSCSTIHGRKGAASSEKRELRPTGSVSCNVPRFPGFHHDTSVVGVPCW